LLRKELPAVRERDIPDRNSLAKEPASRLQEIKQEGSSFARAAIPRKMHVILFVQQSRHLSFEVEDVP
jgi:hypothetical protein